MVILFLDNNKKRLYNKIKINGGKSNVGTGSCRFFRCS